MAHEGTADASSRLTGRGGRLARSGAARFWLPFVALVALFSALAVAYAVDGPQPAPGAVRQGTPSPDAPSHGLEPAAAH